ncbi:hypothetical protein Sinac_2885 [Singulisphaera acidiphila DSM 18658]|uniref:Uncharacterized protein n=1 Tax=Singulisphaera acidiphila (strain ATCC BAA-1392 / DSM 18658 / VKM B-2454 / MOB10) TaxID=886293 RepID=L0DCS2_SINAD|nr:hypothetical protein Sinac_2885 [Singulisphaera acidiphila DSM 18658]
MPSRFPNHFQCNNLRHFLNEAHILLLLKMETSSRSPPIEGARSPATAVSRRHRPEDHLSTEARRFRETVNRWHKEP